MIEFFEELGMADEDIGLRVCFSSRHYPQITMMKCQQMILDGQEGHEGDIAKYVKSMLKLRGGKTAEEVRIAVQAKAKGIFMWVVLVVRILNKESDRGITNADLRKCLDRIPAELHDLFQDILQRGIQDNKYLVPILQWISFAQRPLTREELYFAVRSGSTDFVASEPWDPEEDDAESMDLFILDSSKGLAEMTRGKSPTIQFIHESVRDYLRDTGFAALAPELSVNLLGLTHEYLKRCCLSFITESVLVRLSPPEPLPKAKSEEAKSLRNQVSDLFPFLGYAWENFILHAEAACVTGIDQAVFVAALPVTAWRFLNDLFAIHETRRHRVNPSIARIFAHCGAASLLEIALQEPSHFILNHEFNASLQEAIRSKNARVVTALLDKDACAYLRQTEARDLLIHALRSQDVTIFAALANSYPTTQMHRLHLITLLDAMFRKAGKAQGIHYMAALSLLIPSHGGEVLRWAISRGIEDVVRLSVDLGFTLESYLNVTNEHPIATASLYNDAGVVRVLLASRTYAMAPGEMGMPLARACHIGNGNVLRVLLDYGAPVDFLDSQEDTLLIQACKGGHLHLVQLLIKNGADVNLGNGLETPIKAACERGLLPIVKALVESGADPNPPIEITPLSLAFNSFTTPVSRFSYEFNKYDDTFARFLLSRSTNPNKKCRAPRGMVSYKIARTELLQETVSRTLMYGAAIMDNAELLRLLFEKGADANAEDGEDYHDVLEISCRNGREDVVRVLLANGASVACKDGEYYRRVVGEAIEQRRSRILQLLLTEGHGFRAQSRYWYNGELRLALYNGYDEIAKILMDNGVELPERKESGAPPDAAIPPSPSG